MSEDLGNHRGMFDDGDDLHGAAALGALITSVLDKQRMFSWKGRDNQKL